MAELQGSITVLQVLPFTTRPVWGIQIYVCTYHKLTNSSWSPNNIYTCMVFAFMLNLWHIYNNIMCQTWCERAHPVTVVFVSQIQVGGMKEMYIYRVREQRWILSTNSHLAISWLQQFLFTEMMSYAISLFCPLWYIIMHCIIPLIIGEPYIHNFLWYTTFHMQL